MTIRVLVVDDNELIRAGLRTVIGSDPALCVVAEAADGPEALRAAHEYRPNVVLMDVEMPGGDGIVATRRIVEELPDTRVLVLTLFDLDEYVLEALRAGASGFLLKTTEPGELLRAVTACAAGETTVGQSVVRRLVDSYVQAPRVSTPEIEVLTHRELDVLRAMADGLSNAEIAGRLYLSETTVKTHVGRILMKLGVRDRLQAVVVAHRSGLALPP